MSHPNEPLILCPDCLDGYGRAFSVTMSAGNRTLRYECATCGHQWNLTTPEPDDLLRREKGLRRE